MILCRKLLSINVFHQNWSFLVVWQLAMFFYLFCALNSFISGVGCLLEIWVTSCWSKVNYPSKWSCSTLESLLAFMCFVYLIVYNYVTKIEATQHDFICFQYWGLWYIWRFCYHVFLMSFSVQFSLTSAWFCRSCFRLIQTHYLLPVHLLFLQHYIFCFRFCSWLSSILDVLQFYIWVVLLSYLFHLNRIC
jgi:hypothetical protein